MAARKGPPPAPRIGPQIKSHNQLALLASIVDSSDDAIVSSNLDGVVTSWNRAAEMLYGYAAKEILGTPFATLVPEHQRDQASAILRGIRAGEPIAYQEAVRVRKGGSLVSVALTESPIRDGQGTVIGTSSIARDIRAHDRRARAQLERQVLENTSLLRRSTVQQAQLAVLAGIADALAKNVLVDGVLGDVLAACLDMAGVSKGALYLTKGDEALELKHQIGFSEAESLRLRAKFGHADLFAEIANRGRVVAVPSTALSSDLAQRLIIDAGVTSLLIVPVTAGVKTYGAMLLGARNADVADEAALAFARVLGAQMGQAVGMAEAFGRLGASELRYRTLTENANDAICILTRDGVIKQVNRRLTEILGYPAEHFIGRHIEDFQAPAVAAQNVDRYRTSLTTEDKSAQLYEILKQDGNVALMEFSVAPVDIGGEELAFAIGRDVTERRQQTQLLALTAAVGLSLSKGDSLAAALQGSAEALVTHLGAALGRIWTLNERDGVLELQASAGLYTHWNGPHGRVPVGQFKIGRIARDRKPHLTNTVIGDPEVNDQEWARREGMVGFVGHPLIARERVVGVMALFAKRALDDEVISALGSVADQIAVSIERHWSAESLRTAEERMRFALQNANVGIWDMDYTTGVLRWSEVIEAQYGLQPGTFGGTFEAFVERIHPDDRASLLDTVGKAMKSGADFIVQNRSIWPDGTIRWLSGTGRVLLGEHGEPVRAVGISLDVTERRTLEEQYQQAQKMEAVGRLAGGVAHDFNNLLTVILGFCELLLAERDPNDPCQADIVEIQKAGTSAAGLTRQLLAFSRKQIIEPTLLDLNQIATDMSAMLGRLIGEDVTVVLDLQPELAPVKADRGQVEQILMNLAVNARDAMPKGGTLTIGTANVELDEDYSKMHLDVKPGPYVALTLTDTGTGMTPEVQAHLFEPFFTTKEPGKGTGLGMATVYGIVTQAGGTVGVYSEVGRGTSFKVYFPTADAAESVVVAQPPVNRRRAEGQTVLLVEDAEGLRELTMRLLQRQGYTVLAAANAEEAFRLFEQYPSIDVLLTDIVMPGTSGPELSKRLIGQRRALRVVYMSGYTEEAIVQRGVLKPGITFLHKPFTSETLGQKIREVLER